MTNVEIESIDTRRYFTRDPRKSKGFILEILAGQVNHSDNRVRADSPAKQTCPTYPNH